MSTLKNDIHDSLKEVQTKIDNQGELSSNDLELLLLSALLEEEA